MAEEEMNNFQTTGLPNISEQESFNAAHTNTLENLSSILVGALPES